MYAKPEVERAWLFSPEINPRKGMQTKRRRSRSKDKREDEVAAVAIDNAAMLARQTSTQEHSTPSSASRKHNTSCPSKKRSKHELYAISTADWLQLQSDLNLPTRKAIQLQIRLRALLKDVISESSKDRVFEPGFKVAAANLKNVFQDVYEAVDFMGVRVYSLTITGSSIAIYILVRERVCLQKCCTSEA